MNISRSLSLPYCPTPLPPAPPALNPPTPSVRAKALVPLDNPACKPSPSKALKEASLSLAIPA